jgi:hypothetical protein
MPWWIWSGCAYQARLAGSGARGRRISAGPSRIQRIRNGSASVADPG